MNKKDSPFFTTLFTVTAIVVFFIVFKYENKEEITFLEKELENYISLPVNLNGKIYKVEKGKVINNEDLTLSQNKKILRVAYNSVLNRFDPVFAIEGTEYEKMKTSIENLENSLRSVAASFDENDREIIKKAFYPIDFLASLNETEKIRQKVIYEPNYESFNEYYKNLENTINLYLNYLDILEKEIEKIEIVLGNRPIRYFGGSVTPQSYIGSIKSTKEAVQNKKRELGSRKECLENFSKNCPSLKVAFENMVSLDKVSLFEEKDIPETIISNRKITNKFIGGLLNEFEDNNNLSVFTIKNSACFRNETDIYYQAQWKYYDENENFLRLHFLNDLYFNAVINSPVSYIKKFEENKLKYLYQPITNLYMCPSFSKDFSRVIAMDTVISMPVTELVSNDKYFSPQKDNIFSESNVAIYINEIKSKLKENGEISLATSLDVNEILYAEKLISIFNQKSPRLNEVIYNVIANNSIVTPLFIKESGINLQYLFLGRIYPTSLLLIHNKSFIQKELYFIRPEEDNSLLFRNIKMISYNQDLKKDYSIDSIVEEIILGIKLEKEKYIE